MNREEIIAKAKEAKTQKEFTEILKTSGIEGMTEEAAEKLYKKYVLHELSDDEINASGGAADEELDVSAGGCGVSYSNTCPVCGVGTLSQTCFLQYDPNYGTRTTTLECDNCHYSYDIVDYE